MISFPASFSLHSDLRSYIRFGTDHEQKDAISLSDFIVHLQRLPELRQYHIWTETSRWAFAALFIIFLDDIKFVEKTLSNFMNYLQDDYTWKNNNFTWQCHVNNSRLWLENIRLDLQGRPMNEWKSIVKTMLEYIDKNITLTK